LFRNSIATAIDQNFINRHFILARRHRLRMNDLDIAVVELVRFRYFYGMRVLPGNATFGLLGKPSGSIKMT